MLKGMIMTVACVLFLGMGVQAQFTIGPRVGLGVNWADLDGNPTSVTDGDKELGVHLGAFARIGGEDWFIQPEVIYSSTSSSIIFADGDGIDEIFETDLNKVDIPLVFGIKPVKAISIHGGLVGSILVDQDDNFTEQLDDAFRNYEDFTLGFQGGVGLELGSMVLDLRYEGNFSDVAADRIGTFEFDERQPQMKGLLGFKIF